MTVFVQGAAVSAVEAGWQANTIQAIGSIWASSRQPVARPPIFGHAAGGHGVERRLIWLLATSMARAWTLSAEPAVSLPAPATDVAAEVHGGVPAVLVLDAGALTAYAPSGTILATASVGGSALLLRDQDGDGLDDVLVCGPSGVVWLPWTATFGAAGPVTATPCSALVARTPSRPPRAVGPRRAPPPQP